MIDDDEQPYMAEAEREGLLRCANVGGRENSLYRRALARVYLWRRAA